MISISTKIIIKYRVFKHKSQSNGASASTWYVNQIVSKLRRNRAADNCSFHSKNVHSNYCNPNTCLTFTCLRSTIEILEKGVKYVQS